MVLCLLEKGKVARNNRIIVLGAMSLCGVALLFALPFWQTLGSLFLIGFAGLPHGGMDACEMWAASGHEPAKFVKFIGKYLLIVLGAWLSWWLWPFAFWSVFLLISVYHFGHSSDLFPFARPSFALSQSVASLSKGALVVFVPVVSFPESTEAILSLAASPVFAAGAVGLAPTVVSLALGSVLVVAAFELAASGMDFAFATLRQTVALYFLFSLLPALVSFALYFVFVHSIPQMHETVARFPRTRARVMLAVGIAFSLPPLVFFAAALSRTPSWPEWAGHGAAYIFVVLAVLHFPHFWLSELHGLSLPQRWLDSVGLKGLFFPNRMPKILE